MNLPKWKLRVAAAGLAFVVAVLAAQEGNKDRREVLVRRDALMKSLETSAPQKLNVAPADGRLLKILAETIGAKRVLEIGSSYGYSALWIGQGLERTGGHLWTVEIDASRARQCRENIKEAGLETTVTSIEDDAFKAVPKLDGPFDMVFLDGWKTDYKRYLDMVGPRVRIGGVIVADSTIEKAKDVADYLEAVNHSPNFDSVTLNTTATLRGMTISYKVK
jgi:predicted O-methyltransferase YrrM